MSKLIISYITILFLFISSSLFTNATSIYKNNLIEPIGLDIYQDDDPPPLPPELDLDSEESDSEDTDEATDEN